MLQMIKMLFFFKGFQVQKGQPNLFLKETNTNQLVGDIVPEKDRNNKVPLL